MKSLLPNQRRAMGKKLFPKVEALEDRQLLSGFQMFLEQPGFEPVTINDNGPGDFSPIPGFMLFINSYGNFPVNAIVGISMGRMGGEPGLILSSLNVAGPEGGVLRILLADDNFVMPAGGQARLHSEFGGTLFGAGGSVNLQSWADGTNSNQASGLSAGQPGPSTTSVFANSLNASFQPQAGPYSLVNEATIALPPGGLTSFGLYTSLVALNQDETPERDLDPGFLPE